MNKSTSTARLSSAALSMLTPDILVPAYQRTKITCGIVHLGSGNFHRAHQAVYCDALLNQGETQWGITGVSLRSPDVRNKLLPQNFLYTQATLGDTTSYRVIGSIQDVLVAPENPQAVIDVIALCETQLVTTTITEKGYCFVNGEIDLDHPSIASDVESLEHPQTTYGYLAAALVSRAQNLGRPLTVLCCDNLHAGGEHLRQGVDMLLLCHHPEARSWVAQNVSFASSMVDRVTPATDQSLKDEVTKRLGIVDAAPVAAEPFTQWVIEDRFAGERPPFDLVGALFVDDIEPFERIKLRFLNAGHSMLAALGYLAGDRFIHEALTRPALASFTEQALKCNVLPIIPVPEGVTGDTYIDQVLERFANSNLPYAVLQVGSDSSQKIQQRWLPSIDEALAQGRDVSYLAFALAAWVSFTRKALVANELNDPLKEVFALDLPLDSSADVQRSLRLIGADRFACYSDPQFMATVEQYHNDIEVLGVEQALASNQFSQTL